ncbi:MAG: hypothetical protein KJ709_00340 [Nanoarchaeota archaeon]|nr:hypothetical protein [Nanoarchaeota archaeon]
MLDDESFEEMEKRQKTEYFKMMVENLEDPFLKARMLSRLMDLHGKNLPEELKTFVRNSAQELRDPLRKLIDERKREYSEVEELREKEVIGEQKEL